MKRIIIRNPPVSWWIAPIICFTGGISTGLSQVSSQQLAPHLPGQPAIVNSSEKVEMEKIRVTKEAANAGREEAVLREQVLLLQKKLLSSSIEAGRPQSVPSNYPTFINANAADIENGKKYNDLLKSTLNDLVPKSPYRIVYEDETSDPTQALKKLEALSRFPEDEDISRTIQAQIAALRSGVYSAEEKLERNRDELLAIQKQIRNVEKNLLILQTPNIRNGATGSNAAIAVQMEQAQQLKNKKDALIKENNSLTGPVSSAARQLQFQQLIVQLAFQKRYIHSLIAAGFYRVFKFDLSVRPEAYPQKTGNDSNSGKAKEGSPGTSPVGSSPVAEIPFISTVTGFEAFLLNRIRDAIKDREAIDNMLKTDKLSSAESLLQKMLLISTYQPELHTIPQDSRQRIHGFSQTIRELSETLTSRNYKEIIRLADEIEDDASDVNLADVKSFAKEQTERAMFWLGQAEVALNVGDRQSMQILMDAAMKHAPLDESVKEEIEALQDEANGKSKLGDEMRLLLKNSDYETAFERRSEFSAFANSGQDPQLKADFEAMIKKEESVKTTLKECDGLADRSNHEEAWMVLNEIETDLKTDHRVVDRLRQVERECQGFVSAYTEAGKQEDSGHVPLALAWYLSAFSEAPSSTKLKEKIESLGSRILKN